MIFQRVHSTAPMHSDTLAERIETEILEQADSTGHSFPLVISRPETGFRTTIDNQPELTDLIERTKGKLQTSIVADDRSGGKLMIQEALAHAFMGFSSAKQRKSTAEAQESTA